MVTRGRHGDRASLSLREEVAGGDRRSIGRVPAVVRLVSRHPESTAALVRALADSDPIVRMRAADALEKVSAVHPHVIHRFTTQLLRLAASTDQQELRWHLAQMVPRLQLTAARRARWMRTLSMYLDDPSSIVRTFALQALADLAASDPRLRRRVDAVLQQALRTGTPAMRARARRILAAAFDLIHERCSRCIIASRGS